jgi:hypothetical protein
MNNYLPPIPRNIAPIGSPQANTKSATTTNRTAYSYAQDHWTRYGTLKGVEDAKNTLIEDILSRYDAVVRQCNTLAEEQNASAGRDSSANKNKMYQELQEANAFVTHLQNLMNGSPFITMVIDGNSLLFDEAFVHDGENGGRRAAMVLKDELTDWVPTSVKHAPSDFKIMVKVCANFKYLAGTYMRAGVIDSPSTFGDFSRGFNTLFDIIDIGNGDVNSKVVGMLQLHPFKAPCNIVSVLTSFRSPQIVPERLPLPPSGFWRHLRDVECGRRRRAAQRTCSASTERSLDDTVSVQDRLSSWNLPRQQAHNGHC